VLEEDRRLSNMVGPKTRVTVTRDAAGRAAGKTRTMTTCKVHNVLHCKRRSRGGDRTTGCCGRTFNRDTNAARNMLRLLLREIEGLERPAAFVPRRKNRAV
jgi:hypothetical protein